MLNNYDETLKRLAAFIIENAPAGAARDLARMRQDVAAGYLRDWHGVEFKPTDDVGATLYVRVEGPESKYGSTRIMDAEGNRWYAYVVRCEVTWASWGSADLPTCQRRIACMAEVARFAAEVEREFAGVFHRLDATAAEIAEAKEAAARLAAEAAVKSAVLAASKGMKVGQTKSVVVDAKHDLTKLDEVLVERKESGRTFKYSASAAHGLRTGEVGLVYFMRLEA